MEKALEVERDIQENQDTRAKESPPAKRFRYLSAPRMGSPGFRFGGSIGPSVSPAQRTMIGSWPRDAGSLQDSPHTSFPRYNSAGITWCPRCNRNHAGNCLASKQCFACGHLGHMRRDCPTLHGHSGAIGGTGRQTSGIAPTAGPSGAFRRSANTIRPAMTQVSVQQPGPKGE